MIDFLHSNLPPLKTGNKSFSEKFDDWLYCNDKVQIATGYITADSLTELHKTIELNQKPKINLVIGMHYFSGFTRNEYNAALNFSNFLSKNKLGKVYLCTVFKYHGKLYSFIKDNSPSGGIIGSNNLSSITEYGRVYESSVFFDEPDYCKQLNSFINKLIDKCKPIDECKINDFKKNDLLLDNFEEVEKANIDCSTLTSTRFKIPLKATNKQEKSNLNVFFGKGRKSKTGLIKPRPWYEIELIVPSSISMNNDYPGNSSSNIFQVITDDGWKFSCKVSGSYNKNFRSEGNLKILGKWIKGRLEDCGVLNLGEKIDNITLENYGRSDFDLVKTNRENIWYLDFSSKK